MRLGAVWAGLPLALAWPMLGACSQHPAQKAGSDRETRAERQKSQMEPLTAQQVRLKASVDRLGAHFAGKVGIAVKDLQDGWSTGFDEKVMLPQQSVSKLWVAITALDQADRGEIDLSSPVVVTRKDLTVFHQPIRELAKRPGGFATTLDDLLVQALTRSDNTANDVLLHHVGGPDAVRTMLAKKGLKGIRFGPGEILLQSSIAGLSWKPEYSLGRAFFYAREAVPEAKRRKAFEGYLADPVDGASARAVVDALARLHAGKLLSPASTQKLLGILHRTKSGPNRLKGGVPPGWSVAHKTGTGQVLGPVHSGYNDVGILTAPSGRSYAVAVMIGRTQIPVPERMEFMHRIDAAIVEYEGAWRDAPK